MISHNQSFGRRASTFVLAFLLGAFAASGIAHARPSPGSPLNATVCKAISGTWVPYTCTIPADASGVVSASFKIGAGVTLDVLGNLTINEGVTVTNAGTMWVHNAGGIVPDNGYDPWATGVLVFGAVENSGNLLVENTYDTDAGRPTEGITLSFTARDAVPSDPEPLAITRGTLTNTGNITVQNVGWTRGIKVLGTMTNAALGTISVANSVTSSVGIYIRREDLPPTFYVDGTLTNAGKITVQNSGDSSGYGLYNVGLFTNLTSGSFIINPSQVVGDAAGGLYNSGNFTNFGQFTNDRGVFNPAAPATSTWGSVNPYGTMINHGNTDATGTFYNEAVMINLGTITSSGVFADLSTQLTMINYGTLYNYGVIHGGTNKGMCIDETTANPGATGC